ncbi:MAG: hypothetical protein DMG31_20610 [Acidobacteria bacterium]|nr:MAG: hypothetical protein DMG31_20610 [Acidobacteriota bacterium]
MHAGSWVALLVLGAFHGINPAMGWLFAVALGLQEHRRGAVFRALMPLAAGHALAILAVIVIAALAGLTVSPNYLRWAVAAILIGVGLRFLVRHPHLRWAGMRVGMGELTLWSFLVASVHGAGLMVLPIFMGMSSAAHGSAGASFLASGTFAAAVIATAVHAASYLLVSAAVALLVFEKLGIGVLRKAWFNVDLIWATALMGTGVATLVM